MTTLSTLPKLVTRRAKRLGRGWGSGSGAKSGRGTTRHQKARTDIPLHFEGGQNKITKKYPLLRGKTRNKSIKVRPYEINVSDLDVFKKDTRIDVDALIKAGLVTKDARAKGAKILGRGQLTVALMIALPASAKAVEKIQQAGGTLITS